MHSIEAGKYAGETIGKAVEKQQFDIKMLSEYEDTMEGIIWKKLHRNYVVKEIMLDMEDKTLDMLADFLKDYKLRSSAPLASSRHWSRNIHRCWWNLPHWWNLRGRKRDR